MDAEYRAQREEQLRVLRRLQHIDETALARAGLYADPYLTLRIQDRAQGIAQIEAELGIERPVVHAPPPVYRQEWPIPEPAFRERIASGQSRARQESIVAQFRLLDTHRRNLAHYRAQAKAHGGVDLAPPITRHGINEARTEIAQIKRILRDYGEDVDDLAGDE